MATKAEYQARIDTLEQRRKSLNAHGVPFESKYPALIKLEQEYVKTMGEMSTAANKVELAPLMLALSTNLAALKADIAEGDEETVFTVDESPPSAAAAPVGAGVVDRFKAEISKSKPAGSEDEPQNTSGLSK